jgi:hypothetical protein
MLDGFRVAFTAAAMLAVRKRDVANIDPDAAPLPGA